MSRKGRVWQRGRTKGQRALKGVPWFFVVDVSPPGHKRAQITKGGFPTQAAAQEALDEVLVDARSGTFVRPQKLTLAQYLNGWLESLETVGRRPTTIDRYRRSLLYARAPLGDVNLQDLRPIDLDKFYSELLRTGRRQGPGGLSARSVRLIHSILGKALSDAERKGLVARNVARLASPPSAKSTRAPEMTAWAPGELRTFLEETADHHHGALFHLVAMTGLRRGEVCGLRWSDIDVEKGTVSVVRTITTVNHRPVEGDVKSQRSRRVIDLDAGTVAKLQHHRRQQVADRLQVGEGYTDQDLVFARPEGGPWNPDSIGQAFSRLVGRSDLPTIRFHDLRHTHASHLLAAGVNIKVVSERIGHASTSFTLDVYGHVMPGQQADAAAAVAQLVAGRAS